MVRITGQPPLAAKVYELQKLRCHLCGQVFTAPAPEAACERKYDATAGNMIGILKYGCGLPFNRLDGLQGDLDVPLPASTQWDIVRAVALNIKPAFDELIRQAAQGDVLHNDDTTVKILELMGQRDRPEARSDAAADAEVAESRRGLYTSGVVALRDGRRVALFFSGRRHAGENLAQVLKHRVEALPPPIQMCDALSRNLPGELRTILRIAWPMPVGGSSRSTIVSPSRATTSSNRWPWSIATTPSRGSVGWRPGHVFSFTRKRAGRRCKPCTTG